MPRIAVYAGSFDPFTNGHLDIIRDASKIFERVIVVCAANTKKTPVFSRLAMRNAIREDLTREKIDNAVVIVSDKLTADVCANFRAKYLIRGLRNTTDFLQEEEIAKFNARYDPNIKTVYLRAKDNVISSSMVRELLSHGKDVSKYVPPEVLNIITQTKI